MTEAVLGLLAAAWLSGWFAGLSSAPEPKRENETPPRERTYGYR